MSLRARSAPALLTPLLLAAVAGACTEVRIFDQTLTSSGRPAVIRPLRYGGGLPARSFDPNGADGWCEATALIHARLYTVDGEGRVVGDLVEDDEQDGRTLRCRLRGATFHDGRPVLARDVVATVASLERDPGSGLRVDLEAVLSVEAQGEDVVVFHLKRPFPELRDVLTEMAVLPPAMTREADDAEQQAPVGAGPYRLVSNRGRRMLFRAHEGWHHGRPPTEWVLLVTLTDDGRRARALADGDLDVAVVASKDLQLFQDPRRFRIHRAATAVLRAIVLDTHAPGLEDACVRRALSLLVDRGTVLQDVADGFARPAWQFLAPINPAHDERVTRVPDARDEAARLLRESGFSRGDGGLWERDGAPLRVRLVAWQGDAFRRRAVQAIVEGWRKEGIAAAAVPVDHAGCVALARDLHGRAEGYLGGWNMLGAPAAVMSRKFCSGGSQNRLGFADAAIDDLLLTASRTPGPDERVRLVRRAQRRVLELAPWIPLAFVDDVIVARSGIEGFEIPFVDSWYEYPRFLAGVRVREP